MKFDNNHQIEMFAVCLPPFTGCKTATTLTVTPFDILDRKQRGRINTIAKLEAIQGFVASELSLNSQ